MNNEKTLVILDPVLKKGFTSVPNIVLISQRRLKLGEKEYLIRVVFKRKGDILVVLTAYKTSKISKYRGCKI